MSRRTTIAGSVCATVLAFAAPARGAAPIALKRVVRQLDSAVAIAHAGDGSGRLYIGERQGRVRLKVGPDVRDRPFLDISEKVRCCEGEYGLLSLAFHPKYSSNGFFYVSYSDLDGNSVVSRFTVTDDPEVADPGSEAEILRLDQPDRFHNVGHVAFGPDGYLYIGSGDGQGGGDPDDNAQRLDTLYGKLLRIDVDTAFPYSIPPDNPFVGTADAQPEIWAYGLRNPWRFSFDRRTGDLLIGDVGEKRFEEVNFQSGDSTGGENYGWRLKEAHQCFRPEEDCDTEGLTEPVLVYEHRVAPCSSVTAGHVYRGPDTLTLPGLYVFGDFCTGEIFGARRNTAGKWLMLDLLDSDIAIASFGEDERGRLFLADIGGRIWKIQGRAIFQSDFESTHPRDWSRNRGGLKNAATGLRGSKGALELPLDGGKKSRFLRSFEPGGMRTFRVRFDLNANRTDLDGRSVELLRVAGPGPHLALRLEESNGKYRVRLLAAGNEGPKRLVGLTHVPAKRTVRLEVRWMQASGPDAADGEAFLLRNDRVKAFVVDLDNDRLAVDSVMLGLPSGAPRSASGTVLIDNYVSTP